MLISKSEFQAAIEKRVLSEGITYLDAIVQLSEEYGIDIQHAAKLTTGSVKAHVEREARDRGLLSRQNKLDI